MASPETVRIGTRGSPLALYQARLVAEALKTGSEGALKGEIVTLSTKGDQLTTERLINSGGKGLFTREIDDAVDRGDVDIAVHSLKDMPSDLPDGQTILAYPKRADPRDGFLSRGKVTRFQDLPKNSIIGTASLRREAQALALRPDLKPVAFRGNVQTRLRKLEEGLADATFLAMAGLERLGLAHLAHPVPTRDMLPAAGQGIIAVAGRPDQVTEPTQKALEDLNDPRTECMATAERAFLKELDGSCRTAMAAQLTLENGGWVMTGEVMAPDGQERWQRSATALLNASLDELEALGQTLGRTIRADAGDNLPIFEGA